MTICEDQDHDPVCYEGSRCPACDLVKTIRDLEEDVEELEKQIEEHECPFSYDVAKDEVISNFKEAIK